MLPIAIFFLILFAAAMVFAWLMDNPGTVTIDWLGTEVVLSMVQTILALAVLVALAMILWALIAAIIRGPQTFDRFRKGRRRDKGYDALSRGLIAAGAGNAPLARRLTKESRKYLDNEPLVAMLDAQTSLIENDRMAAREKFAAMMDRDETRLLGLRGLYLEAEREGATEAAAQYARAADEEAPGTPWAAKAALKTRVLAGEWEDALAALQAARSSNAIDKDTYNRHRAVLLTARALAKESSDPSTAKTDALRAHKLAPDLVPAALVAARTAVRLGSTRKAASVLEKTWRENPHPDIAEAYIHIRNGDSANDRFKRAETLNAKRSGTVEGAYALAKAALDKGDYARAREEMKTVLKTAPTEKACLLMADIEEADTGDTGRVREWLARAVTAPRDAVWTDGTYSSKNWAPISPSTGEIDAFEWRVPMSDIDGPAQAIDYDSLINPPAKTPGDAGIEPVETQVAASRLKTEAEDAEIIDPQPPVATPVTPSGPKPVPSAFATSVEPKPAASGAAVAGAAAAAASTTPAGKQDAAIANTAGFTTPGAVPADKAPESAKEATSDKTAPSDTAKAAERPASDTAKPVVHPAAEAKAADKSGTSGKSDGSEKPLTEPATANTLPVSAKPAETSSKPALDATKAPTAEPSAESGKPEPHPAYPRSSEETLRNLDADQDGVLDRSPDDPGVSGEPKPKGLLNRMGIK